MIQRTYSPRGPLALVPAALGMEAPGAADRIELDPATTGPDLAIVSIRGPLMHHEEAWWDSYEAITARVRQALADRPRTLLLRIDSPGGLVSGAFECSREIRQLAAEAGTQLLAYVDGEACSAAYALACAASVIYCPPTGAVGSIGVIDCLASTVEADRAHGIDVRVITSGSRKADGHPATAIDDPAVIEAQRHVDYLASLFFELVSTSRPGLSASQIEAMNGAIEIGERAKLKGLVDHVISLTELLGVLRAPKESKDMDDLKSILEMLQGLAESEDPEVARMARAMLDAAEPDESSEDETPAEAMDEDEDKPSAMDGDEDEDEIKDPVARKAISKLRRQAEAITRDQLLASRPDLTTEQRATLSPLPVSSLRVALAAIPRRAPKAPITTLGGAQGEGEGQGSASHQSAEDAARMDRIMGLTSSRGVVRQGNTQIFGAPVARNNGVK